MRHLWISVAFLCNLPLAIVNARPLESDTITTRHKTVLSIQNAPQESLFTQPFVATPDMASLSRTISYPINYSTGTPQIDIPLYTIQCGTLVLPISLSYNASGVRVNDVSGMVGQGWSLCGIPTISRQIKGHIDSGYTCDFNTNQHNSNYQYVESLLDSSNPFSSIDESPDEYYYQLANKKGMFMYIMQPNGAGLSYASFPYNDVKISLTNATYKYFTLTDDDGTTYRFNGGKDYSPIAGGTEESGWKASSMVAANGIDSICFTYLGNSAYTLYQTNDSYTVVDDFETNGLNRWPRIDLYTDYYQIGGEIEGAEIEEVMKTPVVYKTNGNYRYSYQVDNSGNLYSDNQPTLSPLGFLESVNTSASLPNTITFKGNTISFGTSSNDGTNVITSIIVRNSQNQIVRRIRLEYEFYPVKHRSFLTSVCFTNAAGDKILERYSFEYYNPANLPGSGDRGIDFWGYYNGGNKENSGTLIPRMTLRTIIDNSGYQSPQTYVDSVTIGASGWFSRASDEQYMIYGSLKSITYPTGAKDIFTYEANQVKFSGNRRESDFYISDHLLPVPNKTNTYYVGGLRIKQIKSLLNGDSVNYRTFQYNTDGTGSSPIDESTNYFVTSKRKYYYYTYANTQAHTIVNSRYRVISSSPVVPLSFNNGAVVMYEEVTEYNGRGENDNSGKTVYKYSVPSYTWYPVDYATRISNKYKDWQYGHLREKSVFKKEGSSYLRVTKDTYSYTLGCNVGKVWAGEYELKDFTNSDGNYNYPFPAYLLQFEGNNHGYDVNAYNLTSCTKVDYDGNGNTLTNNETYSYSIPYSTQMTSKAMTQNGETYTENYEYPYHHQSSAPYSTMVSKNILSPVVTSTSTRNEKSVVTHTPYVAGWFKPSSVYLNYNGEGLTERITYTYDEKGNKVQASKDGRENVVYLYGYNSQYIVAVIENAQYSTVQSVLGSGVLANIRDSNLPTDYQWNLLNSLRNNSSYKNWHVTTYQYKPLVGVTKITDPAGQTFTFTYDDLGRLLSKGQDINGTEVILETYEYHYKE